MRVHGRSKESAVRREENHVRTPLCAWSMSEEGVSHRRTRQSVAEGAREWDVEGGEQARGGRTDAQERRGIPAADDSRGVGREGWWRVLGPAARWWPCRTARAWEEWLARMVQAAPLLWVCAVVVLVSMVTAVVVSVLLYHKLTIRDWLMIPRMHTFQLPEDALQVPVPANVTASVVIMSFARPENVRFLTEWYLTEPAFRGVIREVLIWNAKPSLDALVDLETTYGDRVRVLRASPDLGLHSRYAAALLAREPVVFMQDDDIMTRAGMVREILARHSAQPDVIHGLWARFPNKHHPYPVHSPDGSTSAPIILTKVLVARRELFAQFFTVEPFFAPLARTSKPVWNGEDIVLSLAVLRRNGGKHNARHGDLTPHTYSLNTESAISGWHYHMAYRKELTKVALVTLGIGVPDWGFEEFDLPIVAEPPLLAPLPWERGYLGVRPDIVFHHPKLPDDEIRQAPAANAVHMKGRTPLPGLIDWLGPRAYGMPPG
jgi:hypothetical protein